MSIAMVGGLLRLERRHRPDHQRHRPLEALPRRRHGPRRRRPRPARHDRRRPPTWSWSASSWRSSASASAPPCRTSCSRCRTTSSMSDMGAASSVVAFFRSMGGSIGISALGAVLSHQVADKVANGLAALGIPTRRPREPLDPRPGHACPAPVRAVFEHAFGAVLRPPLPGRRAVRGGRAGLRAVHQGGAAAHLQPRGRGRGRRPRWRPSCTTPSSSSER